THLVGGSMSYEYRGLQNSGNYRYLVTVKMYRDCQASDVDFDNEIEIGIYNNNSNRTRVKTFTAPLLTQFQVTPPSSGVNCPFDDDVCIRQGLYQVMVDVPASTVGYHLVYRRCCRNTQNNILDEMGQTYYAYIPNTSINNSSPFFTEVPAPYICRNDLTSIYNTAKDKDGDSLVYELATPWAGASADEPIPVFPFQMPEIPNFEKVLYKNGYSFNNPFGNTGIAQIDSRNGVTELRSPTEGRFSIAIDVSEYRNNVLISKIRLDIQMIVINCPPNTTPDIKTATNQTNFTVEEGEELCFDVTGTDADNHNIKIKGAGDLFDGILGSKATLAEKSGTGTVTSQFCWNAPCGSARLTPYPATIDVTDDGCPPKRKLININITVVPFVGVSSINGPSPVCAEAKGVSYSVNGKAGSTYKWTVQGGIIVSGAGTNTIQVDWSNGAFGRIEVIEVNSGGCEGQTAVKNVVLLAAPSKPIIQGPDTVCSPSLGVDYQITPTNGNTYTWSVEWGTISQGQGTPNLKVNWVPAGQGLVRVFQTSPNGCQSEPDTLVVAVIRNEVTGIVGNQSVCPHSVNIEYGVQQPDPEAQYLWTINKGQQVSGGTGPTIQVNWGEPDTGFVRVIEINKFGCQSTPFTLPVAIEYNLQSMVPLEEDTLCEFTTDIEYRVNYTNGSLYFWDVNGGTITSFDSTEKIRVDWGAAGMASVMVIEEAYDTVNNKVCRSQQKVLPVFLAPVPKVNPIIGPDEICESNLEELYYQNGFQNSTYEWSFNGGSFTGQGNDSINILPQTPGTFTITAVETSPFGCTGPVNSKSIIVHPKPRTEGIFGDSIICYPRFNDVVYQVNGFNSSTFNWTFNGGSIENGQGGQTVILDFNGQDVNQIQVQEISDFGCPGDTLSLEVFADNPSLDLEVVSVVWGDDTKMEVKWKLIQGPRYNREYLIQRRILGGPWVNAGTASLGNEYFVDRALNTDDNTYEYRIVGYNLCGDTLYSEIHRPVRLQGFKPEDDDYAMNVFWSRYFGWDNGVERYELYRQTGNDSFQLVGDPSLDTSDFFNDGTKTFKYCYRVKSIELNTGVESWSNEICFGFKPILYLPNAFSPNGDRINDELTWYYASIKTFKLRIYDRWGELIYTADSPEEFWNGEYKGTQVPEGVYMILVDYTGFDGKLNLIKGNLTVIR
ncbi:MAG: gliding motility-associated C-terminal domain-containing protein, partial [Bacteroidota bacterium]|nr:gliding motility-associated C-terminal domain-containing protein [Bacteroidota bacterium]MDX5430081.1 gliding motility-associated C-terminal domain-containing protein [Bacteroidota bacterium]MDX5468845.1 gliding motility-associated C-terminal domain-containing protein [Bacteroidota bacterium]